MFEPKTNPPVRRPFRYCSSCGKFVPARNSEMLLINLFLRQGGLGKLPDVTQEINCKHLALEDRHLLPLFDDNGHVVCQGSPEIAQYLPGQRRAWKFEYDEEEQQLWRLAYEQLLEKEEDA